MAELHGRVSELQDSALALGLALATALWLHPGAVAAQPKAEPGGDTSMRALGSSGRTLGVDELSTSAAELEAMAAKLSSDSEAEREQAIEALGSLEAEALPAIRERVAGFDRPRLETDVVYDTLRSFRHALGSLRADDMIDIAPGIPAVLSETREEPTVTVAERVLLARSLERIGSLEAGKLIADIFATDAHAWRWEMRRLVDRMGVRLLPTLVACRGHGDRRVRAWARGSIEDLGMEEPGLAVQQDDNAVLADLLHAYGEVKDMDAMPVVVSFTTHERAQVRAAARWATEQYGQNAIWQLRRVYEHLTEQDADLSWGWRHTMEEVYRIADDDRLEPVREDLEAGKAALASGDLEEMRARYDAVLRHAPSLPGRAELAPGYATLAARELAADHLDEAQRLYRRAVRLAPGHAHANEWRGELAFIRAEKRLSAGVADVESYEQALALAPGHAGARRALDALTGERAAERAETRRWLALGAALLLALAAFLLLRRRRPRPAAGSAEEDAKADPGPDPLDTAPDTLPG